MISLRQPKNLCRELTSSTFRTDNIVIKLVPYKYSEKRCKICQIF